MYGGEVVCAVNQQTATACLGGAGFSTPVHQTSFPAPCTAAKPATAAAAVSLLVLFLEIADVVIETAEYSHDVACDCVTFVCKAFPWNGARAIISGHRGSEGPNSQS